MKHTLIASVLSIATLLVMGAQTVSADSTCTDQYGGYTTCVPQDLVIDKQVYFPDYVMPTPTVSDNKGEVPTPTPIVVRGKYVENIGTADMLFLPGQDVKYKLIIKNESGETFKTVTVTDILPPYVKYVSGGPSGTTYNAEDRTITFEMKDFAAGQTREFELNAKVMDASAFPSGRSVFCVANTGRVEAQGRKDEDTAQICIQTDILGASTLPSAGFNDLVLLLPFAGAGLSGIALLRKRG